MKRVGKNRLSLILSGIALVAVLASAFAFFYLYPRERRDDYARLARESYDSVFLSMYPISAYQEEDYAYYRGYTLVKAGYQIPGLRVMEAYIDYIYSKNPGISRMYLGIIPESAQDGVRLSRIVSRYPGISFEILPAHPSMEYWQTLTQPQYTDRLTFYENIVRELTSLPNVSVYLFGAQAWLSANPLNYSSEFETNQEVSLRLMLNTDSDHGYRLSEKTAGDSLDLLMELTSSYRQSPPSYPDLTGYHMVFLGDSIIGNATDSTSIPSVVSALTGAAVYNLGYGGNSASLGERTAISLPDQIELLSSGEYASLPADAPILEELERFLQEKPDSASLIFVLNYGLNDYFNGYAVAGADPLDISTYEGALRASVLSIRERFPGARIMLCTPSFVSYFHFGKDACSPQGGALTDYADAVLRLGEEQSVSVFNSYRDLPITASNYSLYLTDGCHHNEGGRFLFSTHLSERFLSLSP